MNVDHAIRSHWSLDDIPFHCIENGRARPREELFLPPAVNRLGRGTVRLARRLILR